MVCLVVYCCICSKFECNPIIGCGDFEVFEVIYLIFKICFVHLLVSLNLEYDWFLSHFTLVESVLGMLAHVKRECGGKGTLGI